MESILIYLDTETALTTKEKQLETKEIQFHNK